MYLEYQCINEWLYNLSYFASSFLIYSLNTMFTSNSTLVGGGVAVMGHIGLTPEAYSIIGGFRAQGRTSNAAMSLLEDALILQDAGCSSMVIECVPALVGKAISERLEIPIIGIGAGGHVDGQVLVYHDLLGMMEHEHYKQATPRFCKKYAKLGEAIHDALIEYKTEVKGNVFPGIDPDRRAATTPTRTTGPTMTNSTGGTTEGGHVSFSPYKMSLEEEDMFLESLEKYHIKPKSQPAPKKTPSGDEPIKVY